MDYFVHGSATSGLGSRIPPERGVVLLEVVRTNNRAGLECMVRSVPL